MKKLSVLCFVLLFSTTSFARQYTQCSTDEFYSVINLPTKLAGTFFMTLGAETDTHVLFEIEFSHAEGANNIYRFINTGVEGELTVPSNIFGRSDNSLKIAALIDGSRYEMICFTRHYQD